MICHPSYVLVYIKFNEYSRPLRDRMEVIRLSGYTEQEKLKIAEQYLIPRQIKNNGLKSSEIAVDEATILDVIRYYTAEAGW